MSDLYFCCPGLYTSQVLESLTHGLREDLLYTSSVLVAVDNRAEIYLLLLLKNGRRDRGYMLGIHVHVSAACPRTAVDACTCMYSTLRIRLLFRLHAPVTGIHAVSNVAN